MADTRGLGYMTVNPPRMRLTRRSGLGAIPNVGAGGTSGVTAPVGAQIDWGGLGGKIVDVLGPIAEEEIRRRLQGGGGGGGRPTSISCPNGTLYDPTRDMCVAHGSPGELSIQDVTDTTSPDVTMSALGLSAQPVIVGEIQGRPIYRCPLKGLVLAVDNRCYDKKSLPRRFRKWKPARKAKISGHDWKMMKRYGPGGSKQQRAKEFAQAAGFAVSFTAKGKPKKKKGKR